MKELVIKTAKPYEGLTIELVDTGSKYEVRVNGKIEASYDDYDRACETFASYNH